MKKILLPVFITLFSINLFAQGVSGGLKAGVNVSSQKISVDGNSVDTDPRLAAHFGVFVTLMFNDVVGLQPEVLYSAQGSKIDDDAYFKFAYLNIPVLLRFNFNETINLHIGPQLGLLMSAIAEAPDMKDGIRDSFNDTEFSLATGLGVDLPIGLGFGGRYSFGLTEIQKGEDTKWTNSNLQFYVSFRLSGSDDE